MSDMQQTAAAALHEKIAELYSGMTTHDLLRAMECIVEAAREHNCTLILWPNEVQLPQFTGDVGSRKLEPRSVLVQDALRQAAEAVEVVSIATMTGEQRMHYDRLLAESMADPRNRFEMGKL